MACMENATFMDIRKANSYVRSSVRVAELSEQVNDAGTHPLLLHEMVITGTPTCCHSWFNWVSLSEPHIDV